MLKFMRRVRKSRGATMVEYGLLASLIAIALIAILLQLGPKLSGTFSKINANLKN